MNTPTRTPPAPAEVTISALLAGQPENPLGPAGECGLIQRAPQEGVDVLLWRGHLPRPVTMGVRDDWGRVQFSFALKGRASFSMRSRERDVERVLEEGTSCISFTPDCSGRSSYAGSFEYVTVSVRPDLLSDWVPNMDERLRRELDSACCCSMQGCGLEMRDAAHAVSRALQTFREDDAPQGPPPRLWLLGQAMVLVSLAVESHRAQAPSTSLGPLDRQRLLRARDLLLADLSLAPTIAQLAQETGLGVVKLKRGFRQLFDHSVYGLFQRERMHEARRRLSTGDVPVTVVAVDLGYANASHFTAAFRKQFGVHPSSFKRRR